MQVSITGRQLEVNKDLKARVNEKLGKLTRYSSMIEEAHVIFSLERFNYVAEITLTGKKFRMAAVEKAQSMESSFDKVMANIENQLKRFRARIKDHKVKRIFEGIKNLTLGRKPDAKAMPHIIKTVSFAAKPMPPEEAALELEMFNKEFIVFRNSNNEKVSVLYRRKDGNYGLIEP